MIGSIKKTISIILKKLFNLRILGVFFRFFTLTYLIHAPLKFNNNPNLRKIILHVGLIFNTKFNLISIKPLGIITSQMLYILNNSTTTITGSRREFYAGKKQNDCCVHTFLLDSESRFYL